MECIGLIKECLSVGCQVLDMSVPLADIIPLVLDISRVKLARVNKAVSLLIHILDTILMSDDISFNKLMLLHQILNRSKILSNFISGENTFNLTQPEIKIFNCSNESSLPVGFLQFHGLLTGLLSEKFPLLSNRFQSVLDSFFTATALLPVNEVLTHSKDRLNPVSIGS